MPNVIRMFRASDDDLLDEVEAPGDGTYDPASLFDLSALDEVDVYFEMATEPTSEYTTPAFVAPTITSAHISDTQGGSVITEASVEDVLWAVANDVTGYPSPALTYQWYDDGSPAGGTDDEESFDTTGTTGPWTVKITVTNAAGTDDATSAEVAEASETAPAAMTVGQWTATDAATDGEITIVISTAPDDGGSAITAYQYRIDGGTWTAFDPALTATGTRTISGLTNGAEVDIEVRAVNAIGAGDPSDVKARTPSIVYLMADGSFATSTGWDAQNGAVITSGEAQFTYVSGSAAFIRAETRCLPNTTYRMTFNMLQSFSGASNVIARFARNNTDISGGNTVASVGLGGATTGTRDFTITTGDWGSDTIYFLIFVSGTGGTYRIDDLTMELDA